MNILFIHGNYPAQFRSLATRLGSSGEHIIKYLTARNDARNHKIRNVDIVNYTDNVKDKSIQFTESQSIAHELVTRGEIILNAVIELSKGGFKQIDYISWRQWVGLYLRLLPEATLIGYFEWYFSMNCAKHILNRQDIGTLKFIKTRNLSTECEIHSCDKAVVPTQWQANQFPKNLRGALSIIFDGIDFDFFKPSDQDLNKNYIKR